MQRKCNANATQMQRKCNANATQMQRKCNANATQMQRVGTAATEDVRLYHSTVIITTYSRAIIDHFD